MSDRPPFKKILIANRGEIAVRIIRACHEMGIGSVAVYADADRTAMHVRSAHEAYHIGGSPSNESYLVIERVIDAAKRSGAEAIHPGYGFLSENAGFARACRDAGIVFIGPPPEAMDALGDKVRARKLMTEAGVPVVPGTPPLGKEMKAIAAAAKKIGYPVLLKASAGGGGKGMRIVQSESKLASALDQARGEAASAFGDDTVFLEKYIERPRHIEFQILADSHGNCIHLAERECSIQRRHQKLIEECPSPVVDAETRRRVGELAVKAVQAAGYVSAGTVEFLRGDDGSFYFMEVNARLQVEHPVTEAVTGIDLVQTMIRIAAGERLPITQEQLSMRGHSIECRIIAEDSENNFMPSPGTIRSQRIPGGPGVRFDGGTYAGYTVPIYYDPLVGKLITWGKDRRDAISRMARALDEMRFDGLKTSVSFHRRVMDNRAFIAGDMHTGFLAEHPELVAADNNPWLQQIAVVAAAVAHFREIELRSQQIASNPAAGRSAWKSYGGGGGWRR